MQKNKVSISKKTVLRVIAAILALLILASFISIIPAERQVIAANAALEVSKIEAEAVEYAGQKKAAENKAIASSLSSQLIDYYTVQQWDGKLPTVTDGTPFISMQLPG